MLGKVVIITGATSGIGRLAAERLAAQGARIVMVARDQRRAERTIARLGEVAPDVAHRTYVADLLSLAETTQVGARIAVEEPRIDVLINNAGNIFAARGVTADGLETRSTLDQRLRVFASTSHPAKIKTANGCHRVCASLGYTDLWLVSWGKWFRPNRATQARNPVTRLSVMLDRGQ